ncbi:calmodulin-binding protein Sha1 [Venturia nashicola]|uniref:Calmodulin-binding protein Sha1 n=1 Tax=Venturia nashicola TaxID=86259 RepID=A0A4Z1NG33_9PEZI|nr:calmodulin-binding protein Sha1 [Venturia nashicola]TLD20191.1 calmodulin-binding protein Sha1 [Venturia nashicola]
MNHYTAGTPCPPFAPTFLGQPYPQHYPNPYAQPYALSTMYEDTADIQYTTELQAQQLRKAAPRRSVSLAPSARQSIAIHEDATSMARPNAPSVKGTSVRGLHQSSSKRQSVLDAQPRRRRVSSILSDKLATASETSATTSNLGSENRQMKSSLLKKEARRRTIYIPEDTTIFTIHPGASMADSKQDRRRRERTPDVGFDLVTLSEEDEHTPLRPSMRQTTTQQQKKTTSRKSLAVAPKRAPLQKSTRPAQRVSFEEDIPGSPTGKENLSPDECKIKAKNAKPLGDLAKTRLNMAGVRDATPDKKSALSQPKLVRLEEFKSPKKRTGSDSILAYSPQPTRMRTSKYESKASLRATEVVKNAGESLFARARTLPPLDETTKALPQTRSMQAPLPKVPFLLQKAQQQSTKYQVLSEDLAHPELYEDHWLDYQEIALSQLVNSIFEPHGTHKESTVQTGLRKNLITLYHDPQIPLQHKRLQASLLYGALRIPKDMLAKASRIKDDVGLKKKFLSLFSETYDLTVLQSAAEVVIGRDMSMPKPRRSGHMAASNVNTRSSTSSTDGNRLSTGSGAADDSDRRARSARRAVERFLDTFLVKHEDAVRSKGMIANIARSNTQTADDFGSQGWAWRRTVLRSLMLISLLDQAKSKNFIKDCLFQSASPHKSSTAVLTALGGLLLPSLGDIARPLSHLNYTLETIQYPLEEFQYQITNLATDLRDGVMLTRLVELILFNRSADGSAGPYDSSGQNQSMTISMPTGEVLTSSWTEDPAEAWILSQHLKFPCAGRAQKIYNVQIALSALTTLGGAAAKASCDITADDVVDGHREKTLSLLWAVVGHCGLSSLVNWQELKREIHHYRVKARRGNDITAGFLEHVTPMSPEPNLNLKTGSKLLLTWAQSITALQGLNVTNLTSSFADPRVLECIVDAYLPYFPQSAGAKPTTLPGKLRALGCSPSFTTLFTPNAGTPIPSQSLTLTTLTYLSSRLLPLSLTHRAATTLQRVFRQYQIRKNITKRVQLAQLAHHCARVVCARERVVDAATVLQRAWRSVLSRRIDALLDDVTSFQAVARGWAIREKRRNGGKVKERRRGVW